MSIADNIQQLRASLPQGVTLVAVSKFHPVETVWEAYDAGHRVFGESRAQEVKAKKDLLPDDIEWHFIGTLQTNKVKDIAAWVHTIHSVDSVRLLDEINRQAAKYNRLIRVLLEIHVAQEETKHGLTPDECHTLLQAFHPADYPHLRIAGIMGMATDTDDETLIRSEFHRLHALFTACKQAYFADDDSFRELSMGMSHDYPLAIAEGSTMIRVGTRIFGQRE